MSNMENNNFLYENNVVHPDVRFVAYLRWLIFFSGVEIVLGVSLAVVGLTGSRTGAGFSLFPTVPWCPPAVDQVLVDPSRLVTCRPESKEYKFSRTNRIRLDLAVQREDEFCGSLRVAKFQICPWTRLGNVCSRGFFHRRDSAMRLAASWRLMALLRKRSDQTALTDTTFAEMSTQTTMHFVKADRIAVAIVALCAGAVGIAAARSHDKHRARKLFFADVVLSALLFFGSFGCFVYSCVQAHNLIHRKTKDPDFPDDDSTSYDFPTNFDVAMIITAGSMAFFLAVSAVACFVFVYRNLFSVQFTSDQRVRYAKRTSTVL